MATTVIFSRGSLLQAASVLLAWLSPAWGQAQFRAIWADAFHAGYKSTSQIDTLVSRCVAGRYNAIIAEVLAYHDNVGGGHGAYWNSVIVPKAADISPTSLDPLAYLCQKAHENGIEVHAWLVTYRVSSSWPPSGNAFLAAHPEYLMVPQGSMGTIAPVDGVYVLDPGSPDAQEYLVSIVRELVTNYEIDGINWDYVRYTVTNAGYPSDTSYANSGLERYKRIYNTSVTPPPTGNTNWNNFRRRTIDELVRRCRAEIPTIRTNPRQPLRHTADLICFGSAPACGSFTSTDAYTLHQNWEQWMARGWLDAAIPMNYKREHCSSQVTMFRSWVDRSSCWSYARHWFAGQATYLNSFENSVTQMQYAYGKPDVDGVVNYSYSGLRATETVCESPASDPWTTDTTWFTSYLPTNLYTSVVPTPTMPWRDPATATEGTLWGRVRDAVSGQYVDDATVTVTGSGQPSVRTDGNGYYTVTLIPATAAGTSYSASASKSGVGTLGTTLKVLAGDVVRYDLVINGQPPLIVLDPTIINRTILAGESLAADTFSVGNETSVLRMMLNYTVSDDAGWLSVAPGSGASSDESNTHTITYDTASLAGGHHIATITVVDPAASNDPQQLVIDLAVRTPGDVDIDGDVDATDFGYIQSCLTPMSVPASGECLPSDCDGDSDVDSGDVAVWLNCANGPNSPPAPNCF